MRPKRKHGRILNVCMWLYILYVRERICSALSDKPPCCGTGCCLTNGSPLTSSLGVSSEIHHVTSWSTCSADILPEMPFRFDSSGLDTIVCLLHNLSAGKMWSNFFFFFFSFFPPAAFNSALIPEVVCLPESMYPLQISLWTTGKGFRLRWICMLFFELGHVQMGGRK